MFVVAALLWEGDRFLVSQRRADQPMPLFWEFPGGKVEPAEAPVEALAREVREELGCEVEVDAIEEVVFHAYPAFDLVMLVYRCHVTEGIPHALSVAQIAWVTPTQLLELNLLPADIPFARRLAGTERTTRHPAAEAESDGGDI